MKYSTVVLLAMLCAHGVTERVRGQDFTRESKERKDARMEWWRDARFGLFIHWGLYSIPAGEWKGSTNHAEWIRTTAQIPLTEYDTFANRFNPVKFDPAEWVRMAKDAGMKYIVITSKHHDGFCLFDSKQTEFDVMKTPFKRDILKELAEACRKEGLKICWYHSIMDWHHPDYLPRREWEKDRSAEGADFSRYVQYLKSQIKELLTNYGDISVLWFDGEWESTWNTTYGKDLYNYVRSLQPSIIVNNRVGAGRSGMQGMTKEGEFAGDFGTPEQEIPATGMPGLDWETCMTMNNNWGFNRHDNNWKSSKDLIQKLADISSKGGNFLLNVGPTAEGVFPQQSIDRLRTIGEWMKVNGEAVYGTQASPFNALPWGRCTQKALDGGTRLYLHVFNWPSNGKLVLPGIFNQPRKSYVLADVKKGALKVSRREDALVIDLPRSIPDSLNSVVVLDIMGNPDVSNPPMISSETDIFVDALEVSVTSDRENVEIRYTLNGSSPTKSSGLIRGRLRLSETTVVSARCYRGGKPVSAEVRKEFVKVRPVPSANLENVVKGIRFAYFEGDWDNLPNFSKLKPVKVGTLTTFDFSPRRENDHFGFEYKSYLQVPKDGVYVFSTDSDDGSRLYVGDNLVVDNDGLHGMTMRDGVAALAAGLHQLRVTYFDKTGGDGLKVYWKGPNISKQIIPDSLLFIKQ
jgi:alpha-L-fucosidase